MRKLLPVCVLPAFLVASLAPLPTAAAQVRKLNSRLAPLPDGEGAARIFEWAFTPDGERVLYRGTPTPTGSPRLYGTLADGSVPATELSTRSVARFQLSPDGTHVGFLETTGPLNLMPSDGSAAPVRILQSGNGIQFAFTPDSTRIVALGNDLRVLPIDGSPAMVLDSRCCGLTDLKLSPDGTQVLYVLRAGPPGGISESLWNVPVDGSSAPRQLSPELGNVDFAFSPDGTRALYRDAATGLALYAVRLDPVPTTVLLAGDAGSFAVTHDSTQVVFTDWIWPPGGYQLFKVAIDGGPITPLSGPLVAGGNVEAFEITADDAHVVYRADQELDGVFALYSVSLQGSPVSRQIDADGVGRFALTPDGAEVVFEAQAAPGAPQQLYGAALSTAFPPVQLSAGMPAGGGLVDFAPRPDSLGVVYTARQDSLTVELYGVPIDGSSAPAKLNAALVEHGDVDGLIDPAFRIDPTGQRIVYRADVEIDEVHELFGVPIDGGASVRLHAPLPPGPTGGSVGSFVLVPGSDEVLFHAVGDTMVATELYRVALAGGPDARINEPLASGSHVTSSVTVTTPDGRWVVYRTSGSGQANHLYAYDLQGSGPPVELADAGTPSGGIFAITVTADSARVVFMMEGTDGVTEIYSRLVDGSAPAVQLSAVQVGNGDGFYSLTRDGERVVYDGNHQSLEHRELFSVPVDGSAPPVKLSGTMASFAGVMESTFDTNAYEIAPNGRWVVFLADRAWNEKYELYGAPIDGSRAPIRLSARLPGGREVRYFDIGPAGDRFVCVADGLVNNRLELYGSELYGGPSLRRHDGMPRAGHVVLSGPLPSGTAGVLAVQISPRGDFVLYNARQVTDTEESTYSVPIDGSAPAVRLGGASINRHFTPDGERVVLFALHDDRTRYELYTTRLDGSQPMLKLSTPLPQGGEMQTQQPLQLTPDGTKVVYLADQLVDNRFELFAVPVDGSSLPVRVNAPLAFGRDVQSFANPAFRISADGTEVVYLADHDENDIIELYVAPMP